MSTVPVLTILSVVVAAPTVVPLTLAVPPAAPTIKPEITMLRPSPAVNVSEDLSAGLANEAVMFVEEALPLIAAAKALKSEVDVMLALMD